MKNRLIFLVLIFLAPSAFVIVHFLASKPRQVEAPPMLELKKTPIPVEDLELCLDAAPEVDPPRNHPPLRIIIAEYVYTVHFTTHKFLFSQGLQAYTIHNLHEIWLDEDQDILPMKVSMTHELLHSVKYVSEQNGDFWVGPTTGLSNNHDFIYPASPYLLGTLRDNPKLVKWLTEK